MPIIFIESFKKSHYSSLYSMSSLVCLILVLLTLLLPLLASFATDGNILNNKFRFLGKYINI
jgi:hypothetical protein